jgi:hypothetical protein
MIQQIRSYIEEFAAAYDLAEDAQDLIDIMSAKIPPATNGSCGSRPSAR